MTISEKRLAANRLNAQKSTGPTTAEGKARASRNAITHGLTATQPMVGAEADEAHALRLASCRETYGPRDDWENYLVDELAGVTLKLGRIGVIERQVHAVAAARASSDLWENDRRLEVAALATRLERQPEWVVAQLEQTPQGCEWLIERWTALAEAAATSGWSEAQQALAHDLLGTLAPFRSGPIGRRSDEADQPPQPEPTPAEVALAQIDRLLATHALVALIDEQRRTTVESGWSDLPNREAATLRRYEASTRRHLIWVMNQMRESGLLTRPRPSSRSVPSPGPNLPVTPTPAVPDPVGAATPLPAAVATVAPLIPPPLLPNEPTALAGDDETNPPTAALGLGDAKIAPPRRPDLAKLAKRERKARRRRGRHRQMV